MSLTAALADCASSAPPVVHPRTLRDSVLVEFYGGEVPEMGKVAAEMTVGGTRVPMTVDFISTGGLNTTQVKFSPEAGVEIPEGPRLFTFRGEKTELDVVATSASMGNVEVVKVDREEFGCGPAIQVSLKIPSAAGHWLRVRLDEQRAYVLVDEKGNVAVGHGMCGGLFRLDEGQQGITLAVPGMKSQRTASFVVPGP